MASTNWHKQGNKPLFADLLWSRPENKRARGKLLIVGGHAGAFSAVSESYNAAEQAGIGTVRTMLPDSLAKNLANLIPEATFGPSTLSGSLARSSLAEIIDQTAWADGVLLAGDFGRNSETGILIEQLASKYGGPLVLAGDSLDYFSEDTRPIIERPSTVVVAELAQLQKLLAGRALIKHSDDLARVVNLLSGFSSEVPCAVATHHAGQIVASYGGQVSTTPCQDISMAVLGSYCAVWQLQQPAKLFEALTSAAFSAINQTD